MKKIFKNVKKIGFTVLFFAVFMQILNAMNNEKNSELLVEKQLFTVTRLACIPQVKNECALRALFNANFMLKGSDLNQVKKSLIDKSLFSVLKLIVTSSLELSINNLDSSDMNALIKRLKEYIENESPSAALVAIDENKLTIIDSMEQFTFLCNGFDESVIGDSHLSKDIREFRSKGTPFAIVLNRFGHWIAYAVRKDGNDIKVLLADSMSKNALCKENCPDEIGSFIFDWVTKPEFENIGLVNLSIVAEIERLINLLDKDKDTAFLGLLTLITDKSKDLTSPVIKEKVIYLINFFEKLGIIDENFKSWKKQNELVPTKTSPVVTTVTTTTESLAQNALQSNFSGTTTVESANSTNFNELSSMYYYNSYSCYYS